MTFIRRLPSRRPRVCWRARAARGADGRLDRNLELLTRDQFLQPRGHRQTVLTGLVDVHNLAKRVDWLALQQDVDLRQVRLLLAGRLVVERRIAAGAAPPL